MSQVLEIDKSHLGYSLLESIRILKGKYYMYLPFGLSVNLLGGFISPRGIYYDNKASGYDISTLKRGYLWLDNDLKDKWDLLDYAYYTGWIKIEYWQSYGTSVSFHDNVTRKLIITFAKNALLDASNYRRLLETIRLYEKLFNKKIIIEICVLDFLNLNEKDIPVSTYLDIKYRINSANAADMILQRIKSRG